MLLGHVCKNIKSITIATERDTQKLFLWTKNFWSNMRLALICHKLMSFVLLLPYTSARYHVINHTSLNWRTINNFSNLFVVDYQCLLSYEPLCAKSRAAIFYHRFELLFTCAYICLG